MTPKNPNPAAKPCGLPVFSSRGKGVGSGTPLLSSTRFPSGSLQTLKSLQSHPRKAHGFSLVELMVVVAIMGIMMALAAVTFRGNADRQAVTQTRIRIARFLSEARGMALSRGQPVAVYLDTARNTLTSFLWVDSSTNYKLDWNDLNFNGLMDPGEGEVIEVYDRINISSGRGEGMGGRRLWFLAGPPAEDPGPQPVGCNIPSGSPDPNPEPRLLVFTPLGNILNSEGFLCADYVVYIQYIAPGGDTLTAKIRVRPSGYVESYDFFG